jgi:hypothetical protein
MFKETCLVGPRRTAGTLRRFDYLSVGDRPNCGSSESSWMHAVAPRSEWQTANLGQR